VGLNKNEADAIYKYVKRIDEFYNTVQSLLSEAYRLELRYGYIVSGYDTQITSSGWLTNYTTADLALVSGNIVGMREHSTLLSGWRSVYIEGV